MKMLLLLIILFCTKSHAILIAHRGVHQTYHRQGLDNETCTAKRISKPSHNFIENTLDSIEEAFHNNADMVEIDIHPTTEKDSPDNLVVFHDWTLDCRTNANCENGCMCNDKKQCETHKQPLKYIQTLDIGYGYTFDNGKTYPFRGMFVGKMPEFEAVLKLLSHYPKKFLLINVKGNTDRTTRAFLRVIKDYPLEVRRRLFYPYKYGFKDELESLNIEKSIDQNDKKCLFNYLKTGWYGHFPKECHNKRIFIPIRETLERFLGKPGRYIKVTSLLWGWPEKFINLANKHGTQVYASQVDSVEEYKKMSKLKLNGIMTNKIELIGPLSH